MPLTTDLDTAIGQVRAELGDDTEGSGVLPNGVNLSDAQIQYVLDREVSVGKTAAGAAAMIARRWAQAVSIAAGPLKQEPQQIYEHWRSEAATLRAEYGYSDASTGGPTSFSAGPVRSDGYSGDNGDWEYARWVDHL